LIHRLATKFDNLFTEKCLEINLDIIVKMGLNNKLPVSFFFESPEIISISNDPNIIFEAIKKAKNIQLDDDRNFVQLCLPLKRNKIYVTDILSDQVKEFEDLIYTLANKEQIQSKEYLSIENNYKIVFEEEDTAQKFLNSLRTCGKNYDGKIISESVISAIRDKYRHKIKQLEQHHNN